MMKTGLKVADAMTVSPYTIPSNTTLSECAKLMKNHHVGALLIRDSNSGPLLGIVTEQDIVRKAVAEGLDTSSTPVSEIMETRLITILPDADISEALIKMRDANIRHLPVVQDGSFKGLLTLKDVLKVQPQLFELLVDKFELREEERKPVNKVLSDEGICELCGNYAEVLSKNDEGSLVCEACLSQTSTMTHLE